MKSVTATTQAVMITLFIKARYILELVSTFT